MSLFQVTYLSNGMRLNIYNIMDKVLCSKMTSPSHGPDIIPFIVAVPLVLPKGTVKMARALAVKAVQLTHSWVIEYVSPVS